MVFEELVYDNHFPAFRVLDFEVHVAGKSRKRNFEIHEAGIKENKFGRGRERDWVSLYKDVFF